MVRIMSAEGIRENYQKEDIVKGYVQRKFITPIGRIEHLQQVAVVNNAIKKYSPKKVLEVACGPARVTRDIHLNGAKGLAVDYSEGMLEETKRFIKGWDIKRVDAFKMNFLNEFDMIFTFRFLFHFNPEKRKVLYGNIRNALRKDGVLIFEAINAKKADPLKKIVRLIHGPNTYGYYRETYKKKDIIKELEENGFEVLNLNSNIKHFYTEVAISKITNLLRLRNLGAKLIKHLENKGSNNNPIWWTIVCRKK